MCSCVCGCVFPCAGFGGTCANGALIAQSKRKQNHHCGQCNAGYILRSRQCQGIHTVLVLLYVMSLIPRPNRAGAYVITQRDILYINISSNRVLQRATCLKPRSTRPGARLRRAKRGTVSAMASAQVRSRERSVGCDVMIATNHGVERGLFLDRKHLLTSSICDFK